MSRVLEALDKKGLVSEENVANAMENWPFKDIADLDEELFAAAQFDAANEALSLDDSYNAFNFLASSSLRGGDICIHIDCRLRYIGALARYSALYSDKLLVPLWLDTHRIQGIREYDSRYILAGTIYTILILKPLVEVGAIVLVPDNLRMCADHLLEEVPKRSVILQTMKRLAEMHGKEIEFIYEPPSNSKEDAVIHIKGPEQYIDHGEMLRMFSNIPDWVPRNYSEPGKKYRIPRKIVREANLIEDVFDNIVSDTTMHYFYNLKYQTRLLGGRPFELEFLKELNKNDHLQARAAALCNELTHEIPLMLDTNIETILKVRKDDREAFLQYRDAITKIVKDHIAKDEHVSKRKAQEIVSDILAPELNKLRNTARIIKQKKLGNVAKKTLVSTAVIGLGVFGGLLPADLALLAKAVGGMGLLNELGNAIASIENNPNEIRNHNLFFLLRLSQGK